MPSQASPVTLRFHKLDRTVTPCGRVGKHTLFRLETSPGILYLVRRRALKETAKGYAQATEVGLLQLVGATWDDTPAGAWAKTRAIKELRTSSQALATRAVAAEDIAVRRQGRVDKLLAGETVKCPQNSGVKLRMLHVDEAAGQVVCEEYHGDDSNRARWARERAEHEEGFAAAKAAGDTAGMHRHAHYFRDSWTIKGFAPREGEPIGEWHTGAHPVRVDFPTDPVARAAGLRRDSRNMAALADSFETGATFTLEREQAPDLETVVGAVAEFSARGARYNAQWNRVPSAWTTQVARDLGCSTALCRQVLKKLAKAGKVVDLGGGRWGPADACTRGKGAA